jgi:hypothetical protein
MTGSNDIRVALIGYGLGGEVFHAPLVHVTEGMRLTSIVTVDPERRRKASRRYPDARILDRNDPSWAAPADHDLVVVCTPNRYHVPLALTAIEAGVPVVVDKPLAPTAAEGRALVEALAGLAAWGAEHADAEGDATPAHDACGTPLAVRWYCPTCDVDVAPGEAPRVYEA